MSERRCIMHPELPCPAKSEADKCVCTPPARGPRLGGYSGPHRIVGLALAAILLAPPRSRRDK